MNSEPILKKHCPEEQLAVTGLASLEPHKDLLGYLMGYIEFDELKLFSRINKRMLTVFRQKQTHRIRLRIPDKSLHAGADKDLLAMPAVTVNKIADWTSWFLQQTVRLGKPFAVDVMLSVKFPHKTSIDPVLWCGLTHLELSARIDTSLQGKLPASLRYLKLGTAFDAPISPLPPGLVRLDCGKCFNQPLGDLPETLACLNLPTGYPHPLGRLPLSLNCIRYTKLPVPMKNKPMAQGGLQYLINVGSRNWENTAFPESLSQIVFNVWFTRLPRLPDGLRYLSGTPMFNSHLPIAHLSKLVKLVLDREFNQPIEEFPQNLQILDMQGSLCTEAFGPLPSKLQQLMIGPCYNHPLGPLPETLVKLVLGDEFNQPLGLLPETLVELELSAVYEPALEPFPLGMLLYTKGESVTRFIGY
jgi:hypothetical protein